MLKIILQLSGISGVFFFPPEDNLKREPNQEPLQRLKYHSVHACKKNCYSVDEMQVERKIPVSILRDSVNSLISVTTVHI